MKTLYIHMGTHKTGSSAMQVLFARNTKVFWKAGLYYPRRDSNAAARDAVITSGNGVELAHYMADRPGECSTLTLFKADMKQAADHNILYSSETFNAFSVERVESFKRLASQFGYKIQCIFLVRSPAGYAFSQYSQLIKRHTYPHKIERYLDKGFVLPFSNIRDAIDMFGKNNVRVENYDANRNNLQAFFLKDILGLTTSEFETVPENVNRSLTQFELELMRNCNAMGGDKLVSTYISDALIYGYEERQNIQKISKENFEKVRERCAKDLEYINSLGVSPPVKMKDKSIRLGEARKFDLNPFQKATLSIFLKLASDQINRKPN